MILSTCYSFWLYNKVFSGLVPLLLIKCKFLKDGLLLKILFFKRIFLSNFTDIYYLYLVVLVYLIVLVIFLGINLVIFISFFEFDFFLLLIAMLYL